jgi:hypothetical protein
MRLLLGEEERLSKSMKVLGLVLSALFLLATPAIAVEYQEKY